MKITVEYAAQIKRVAGVAAEEFDVEPACSLRQLVEHIIGKHGDTLRSLLLDTDGQRQPSILVFVQDDQVRPGQDVVLKEGDVVTFLSPISGG